MGIKNLKNKKIKLVKSIPTIPNTIPAIERPPHPNFSFFIYLSARIPNIIAKIPNKTPTNGINATKPKTKLVIAKPDVCCLVFPLFILT